MTVIVVVPTLAPADAVNVNVEDAVYGEVSDAGLNLAVTPDGTPLALRPTAAEKPFTAVTDTE